MRTRIFLIIAFLGFITVCSAQQTSKWSRYGWLMGAWKGEGAGKPGQGEGTFAFSFDLNGEVIVRRSHSEYPATQNKPDVMHDDLMIIYPDISGNQDRAIYFDNEGHVINYAVTFSDKSIVLRSEKSGNSPIFRLTYTLIDNETVTTSFEMSQDGEKFVTYIEGKSKRAR
jgi:hypothetical protein